MKPYNYAKLGAGGFVNDNAYVEAGDVLIGKCMPQKQGAAIINKDTSVALKSNERGYVDRNCYGDRYFTNVTGDGYTFAKVRGDLFLDVFPALHERRVSPVFGCLLQVRLRNERVPTIGDKVSSRHGGCPHLPSIFYVFVLV